LKGSGDKAFCAGGDLKSVYEVKGTPQEYIQDAYYRKLLQLFYSMAKMKPLQIVFWDGVAIGAGIGIALEAPIRIVTETSEFSMPGMLLNRILSCDKLYRSKVRSAFGHYRRTLFFKDEESLGILYRFNWNQS
jgi:1,4-dihydroxy-2-naphthoyl-CoA synthase